MIAVTRVGFPGWEAHPDVWLIVGLVSALYFIAVRRVGPTMVRVGEVVVTRRHISCVAAGIGVIWIASDYPIHDLAERYLFSIHMTQHLMYSMVAAPLLIFACPPWMARYVLETTRTLGLVRQLSRLVPAIVLFNVVLVITHLPAVVSLSLNSGWIHFAVHCLVLGSGLVLWMPILSPIPEVPRLQPPLQMLYLFTQSVLPTIPAAFLAYGSHAVYRDYETFDRLYGTSVKSDQTIAGLIMKSGAGLMLWAVIAIVFFRWFNAEEGPVRHQRGTARTTSNAAAPVDLDRELLGLP